MKYRILIAITCLVFVLSAQSLTLGDIAGTVTDPSGGFVPKVHVTLKNTGIGETRETDAEGRFRFSLVPPGTYAVTMTASGFRTAPGVQMSNATGYGNFSLFGLPATFNTGDPTPFSNVNEWHAGFNHPNSDDPVNRIAQGVAAFGTINNLVSPPPAFSARSSGPMRPDALSG